MTTLDFSKDRHAKRLADKRFINYVLSRSSSTKTSVQTAQFDTITGRAIFASDFFFKPEELKSW